MIYDCRFGSGLAGGNKDGRKFVCFFKKELDPFFRQNAGFINDFQPESRFIRFFDNRTEFCRKLCPASCAACSTVVGGYRCAAPHDLIADVFASNSWRKRFDNPDHPQCKFLGPFLQLFSVHCFIQIINLKSSTINLTSLDFRSMIYDCRFLVSFFNHQS